MSCLLYTKDCSPNADALMIMMPSRVSFSCSNYSLTIASKGRWMHFVRIRGGNSVIGYIADGNSMSGT